MERGKRLGRCGERRTRGNLGVVKYLHSVGLLDWFRNLTRLLLPLATCGINQVNEYLILFVDSRNTSDNLASAVMLLCAPPYKAGVYKGVHLVSYGTIGFCMRVQASELPGVWHLYLKA
jgi:hypothetical protein